MQFTKMHGAGNDYVLIDARYQEQDWYALARQMCDRHYGVGSDGLLLVALSATADIRMRMFNPDGSEAEMCGNGIRCFAKYVMERDIARTDGEALRIETQTGVLDIVPSVTNGGGVSGARVAMGEPKFHAEDIRVCLPAGHMGLHVNVSELYINDDLDSDRLVINYPIDIEGYNLNISAVSMGNPHAVAFINDPVDSVPLHLLGPVMERHQLFPDGVNFHIVNLQNRRKLEARTWERGAGLTMACGTGACAIQAVARLLGITDDQVSVQMPGGTLSITWPGYGHIYMEGPAEQIFEGEWITSYID